MLNVFIRKSSSALNPMKLLPILERFTLLPPVTTIISKLPALSINLNEPSVPDAPPL